MLSESFLPFYRSPGTDTLTADCRKKKGGEDLHLLQTIIQSAPIFVYTRSTGFCRVFVDFSQVFAPAGRHKIPPPSL